MSETAFQIGVVDFPVAKKLVYADTDIVELSASYNNVPPKTKAATKWRKEAPSSHSFCVQVPRFLFETPPEGAPLPGDRNQYGQFRTTPENLDMWKRTIDFAEGLEAKTLVLLTGSEFTPTKNHMSALKNFLSAVPRENYSLVWEPRGPWEHENAAIFATEMEMMLAVDPLRDTPVPGPNNSVYFRLGPFAAMGARFGIYELEQLVEAGMGFQNATYIFQTPKALDDARNLKRALADGNV